MNHRKLGLAAIYMAAAEAVASTGAPAAAPAAGAQAPDSNVVAAEKPKRAPKNPENTLNIINGRLPLPLVHMIRFDGLGAMSNADAAKAFGTSVGKVFDIKKGRNFGYIDATYKPAADELSAAKAWCETGKTAKGQTLKEAGGKPDEIVAALGKMGAATAEEVAARNWNIRQVGVKSETAPVAAGTAPTAAAAAPAAGAKDAKPAKDGAKLF